MSDEDIHNKLEVSEEERLKLRPIQTKLNYWFIAAPIFAFLVTFFLSDHVIISAISALLTIAIVGLFYESLVHAPYRKLKHEVRIRLIEEFMRTHHPNVEYRYFPRKHKVHTIIPGTDLISANRFQEEDVIEGYMGSAYFYISEVELKKTSGKSTKKVFRGILMKIRIPRRKFPQSRIQSRPNFLKQIFEGFKENKEYNFWYETKKPKQFDEKMQTLFPFIQHLMKKHTGLRIEAKGDELIILLDTAMKFLDTPKRNIYRSFFDQSYYNNMGKQLNSLLFIVESFVNNLSVSEIEERLELKRIEYEKVIEKK